MKKKKNFINLAIFLLLRKFIRRENKLELFQANTTKYTKVV